MYIHTDWFPRSNHLLPGVDSASILFLAAALAAASPSSRASGPRPGAPDPPGHGNMENGHVYTFETSIVLYWLVVVGHPSEKYGPSIGMIRNSPY